MATVTQDSPQVAQMRTAYNTKINEAETLMKGWGTEPGDQKQIDKVNGLMAEADLLKVQLDVYSKAQGHRDFAQQAEALPLAWRNATPTEGDFPVDRKAWRNMTVKTFSGYEREIRYNVPAFLNDPKKEKDYTNAVEAYLRTRGGINALGPADAKTLSEGSDSVGGFTVPPDFVAQVLKKSATLTQMRGRAQLSTTSRDVQVWPRVNYTTDDLFTSPMRLFWAGESPASSATIRAADTVFGLWTVPVNTAMASIPLTNDLLEDSAVDVTGLMTDLFGEAFALGEEAAFIAGNGQGQPMGLFTEVGTNGPGFYQTAGAGVIAGDDLVKLFYTLPVQYRQEAAWLLNSPAMQAVELLKDTQGRYLINSLINASLNTPQFDTIKNKPVLVDEFAPTVASGNFPIMFGDLSGYLIVDRVGLTIQKLQELYAELNLSLFLARKRVGGHCVQPYRMKALKIQ